MVMPAVPIDVDPETGIWTSDGLPMIYVPRHFFVNNHKAVESALGVEQYSQILRQAGHESAYYWCKVNSREHGLDPEATFHHYLKRLSQRGWGLFTIETLDVASGYARIRLDHSVFVAEYGAAGRKVCAMFEGWIAGGMDYISDELKLGYYFHCDETSCIANGDAECIFEARPIKTAVDG